MGAAKIVPRFVAGVKESGQAEVTGIAARNKEKAQKTALELEIPQVYDDYASLVNAAEIDLIYIPLINKQHYPQAKMALEAGKNVLLEKPFTLTLEESQELFKIANEKNLFLMEAQKSVFLPVMAQIKKWLDANEIPFNPPYNRYPDPLQNDLKEKLAKQRGVMPENIFLGVGSDEAIDLLYRIFCEPGRDNAVSITPTYGMYRVCADINGVEYREVPLKKDFSLDCDAILQTIDTHSRLLFLCSPNNPTGNVFPAIEIERLITAFDGIVVVDEAYIDFSSRPSWIRRLNEFHNLVVLQTFSKAWGSAGVRLGMTFASPDIIGYYNQVKYPYNISALVQRYAMEMLDRENEVRRWVDEILSVRSRFVERLSGIPMVKTVYPSDANFVLVKMVDAEKIYLRLVTDGIVVRNRSKVALCGDCLRITIGTDREMNVLLETLKSYS